MFKFVVLFAILALAVAKPSGFHGEIALAAPALAYSAPAVAALPAAVSHQFRSDVIHGSHAIPAVATYAAPALTTYAAAAPILAARTAYAAPAIAYGGFGYGGHLGYAGHLGYGGHLGYAGHYGYAHGW